MALLETQLCMTRRAHAACFINIEFLGFQQPAVLAWFAGGIVYTFEVSQIAALNGG